MSEQGKRILLVEDDPNIAELIQIHLLDMECEVKWLSDGTQGLMEGLNAKFDLIILDVMLPGKNGVDICRHLRMEKVATPIMMLTSKSEEIDKVLGLESGADDYLTKPFSIREFIARVKAIFRRASFNAAPKNDDVNNTLIFDELEVYTELQKVVKGGDRVDLTSKEFDLISLLASNPGKTYSRERILNLVWGYEFEGYEHTVNSHINRLRAKIEPDMSKPKFILTTWGVGYRFNDEL